MTAPFSSWTGTAIFATPVRRLLSPSGLSASTMNSPSGDFSALTFVSLTAEVPICSRRRNYCVASTRRDRSTRSPRRTSVSEIREGNRTALAKSRISTIAFTIRCVPSIARSALWFLELQACRSIPNRVVAWRIAWDPIFFDLVRCSWADRSASTWRRIENSTSRVGASFLLLSKILSRRQTSPRFELRHLAINVLGLHLPSRSKRGSQGEGGAALNDWRS